MQGQKNKTLWLKYTALLILGMICLKSASATVISFTKNTDGVNFKLAKGLLDIKICKADIIEVKYTILNAFPAKKSLVVNNPWAVKTPFSVAEHNGVITITTSKLKINIDKATNAISYTDLKGKAVTSEASENKSMNQATIAG